MRPVEIRLATSDDVAVLAEHRVAMFRDMGRVQPQAERRLFEESVVTLSDTLSNGEYIAWLAHVDDDIIGGAGVLLRRLFPRPDPDRDGAVVQNGPEGIVLNVYVEREWRRRGVARRLMEALIAWSASTDIVRLVLHASDEGKPLYTKLGFVATNEMRYGRALRPR